MSLLEALIGQAQYPKGLVGDVMLKIMNKAHSSMISWAFHGIAIKEDAIMLDIGCGGGQTIHRFAKKYKLARIYGVDISPQSVETSTYKNRVAVASGRVSISTGQVSALPFHEDTFDLITAVQTHYFWPDLINDVQEVFRVLRPKGTFIIVSEIYKINYHMHSFTQNEEIEQLFRQVGFKTVRIQKNRSWRCYVGTK
ncbi:class I SAM-dependent methyltransferase [Paenibacillus sp. GCM10012306]|uniref:class I SAM-dependent methyltransferase n=1 Tax=Paenibacillus sp. GCM10012306 TaxID=3317342 RepID=UPI00361A300B